MQPVKPYKIISATHNQYTLYKLMEQTDLLNKFKFIKYSIINIHLTSNLPNTSNFNGF